MATKASLNVNGRWIPAKYKTSVNGRTVTVRTSVFIEDPKPAKKWDADEDEFLAQIKAEE